MTVWVFKDISLSLKTDQNMNRRPLKSDLIESDRCTNRIGSSINLENKFKIYNNQLLTFKPIWISERSF